jgi:hypothetical protein
MRLRYKAYDSIRDAFNGSSICKNQPVPFYIMRLGPFFETPNSPSAVILHQVHFIQVALEPRLSHVQLESFQNLVIVLLVEPEKGPELFETKFDAECPSGSEGGSEYGHFL